MFTAPSTSQESANADRFRKFEGIGLQVSLMQTFSLVREMEEPIKSEAKVVKKTKSVSLHAYLLDLTA
ncbi:unnamed protein product [Heligmosomoides polygyrus]|uniref:Uncharacterized protein n=1 Tax=Heligmosomoides polygyrus TaxID=6339 RepID=A0A183GBF3_HELPZ|nr:unnamed protein product [Heligmosomoides polygyrus]